MPADKPTELSRIKLKTWTRQPVPMISKHSAHSTLLPVGFRTWLWRYTSKQLNRLVISQMSKFIYPCVYACSTKTVRTKHESKHSVSADHPCLTTSKHIEKFVRLIPMCLSTLKAQKFRNDPDRMPDNRARCPNLLIWSNLQPTKMPYLS